MERRRIGQTALEVNEISLGGLYGACSACLNGASAISSATSRAIPSQCRDPGKE
ncbi:hypothetical protein [Mesorhizobium sp. ES1-4]|uniref:hypothetical protein n=1 Tax=Mesorhizobium sp. ES1-4 TaxID=2876627 RepID=UPI00398C812D